MSFSEGGASARRRLRLTSWTTERPLPEVSKSPDRIAGMFDAIAGSYDFLNHLLSAGIDRPLEAPRDPLAAVDRARARPGSLHGHRGSRDCGAHGEAGRRPAWSASIFRARCWGSRGSNCGSRHLEASVALVRGDATRTPLADRSVDAVTIAFGIRNVENVEAACAEIRRVLTPGGRLAILEFAIPTMRGVRPAYLWYFNRVLPRIGRLVSRHGAAYGYLPASVGTFAPPEEFVKLLRQAGFTDVAANPLTFGIVFLYTARKG